MTLAVGGDHLDYDDNPSSPVVSLLDLKLSLNSVTYYVHTGAIYGTADIKYFYLNNLMEKCQYMKIISHYFIDEIRAEYNTDALNHNGYVFEEIRKGMYGLK